MFTAKNPLRKSLRWEFIQIIMNDKVLLVAVQQTIRQNECQSATYHSRVVVLILLLLFSKTRTSMETKRKFENLS